MFIIIIISTLATFIYWQITKYDDNPSLDVNQIDTPIDYQLLELHDEICFWLLLTIGFLITVTIQLIIIYRNLSSEWRKDFIYLLGCLDIICFIIMCIILASDYIWGLQKFVILELRNANANPQIPDINQHLNPNQMNPHPMNPAWTIYGNTNATDNIIYRLANLANSPNYNSNPESFHSMSSSRIEVALKILRSNPEMFPGIEPDNNVEWWRGPRPRQLYYFYTEGRPISWEKPYIEFDTRNFTGSLIGRTQPHMGWTGLKPKYMYPHPWVIENDGF